MKESEYILLTNLHQLRIVIYLLSELMMTDDQENELYRAIRILRKLDQEMSIEMAGLMEIEEEKEPS